MRERREGEARFLARVIPEGARVVGLVYPASEAARTAAAAAGIASAVGLRREHTLLAAAESGPGTLDDTHGGGDGSGLRAALSGEARLTRVARRMERRPYVYLPAGTSPANPETLAADERLRDFARRVRARGGTLLLHLPEAALPAAAGLLDGYVSLGRTSVAAPEGVREYGRVLFAGEEPSDQAPPPPVAGAASSPGAPPPGLATVAGGGDPARPPAPAPRREPPGETGGPERAAASAVRPTPRPRTARGRREDDAEGRWRRHRARVGAPLRRAALGALAILALAAGWWSLGRLSLVGADDPPGGSDEPVVGVRAAEPVPAAGERLPAGASDRSEALVEAVEGAPELPYSVLLASFARAADARERLAELAGEGGGLFFVAPTPVRGRLYHRVFAGARDEASALALMEELVESGVKEAAAAWDVRPARLAFRLGVHGDRAAAEAAVRDAAQAGIPAYVLAAAAAGRHTAFQVYAGAYESETAARAMEALLEGAGRPAELAPRRGSPR